MAVNPTEEDNRADFTLAETVDAHHPEAMETVLGTEAEISISDRKVDMMVKGLSYCVYQW